MCSLETMLQSSSGIGKIIIYGQRSYEEAGDAKAEFQKCWKQEKNCKFVNSCEAQLQASRLMSLDVFTIKMGRFFGSGKARQGSTAGGMAAEM